MKRFILLFLVMALLVALCACGSSGDMSANQGDEFGAETANLIDYSKVELKTEEIESLTAENFETEVETMMAYLPVEEMGSVNGVELTRDGVGSLLLYYNMADISKEDVVTIVEASWNATQGESGYYFATLDYSNIIGAYWFDIPPEDYFGWARFSYNAQGRAVLSLFDDLNRKLKTDISEAESDNICAFICNYCNNEAPVLVDGQEVYLTDNNELVQGLIALASRDAIHTIKSENKWYDVLSEARLSVLNGEYNNAWFKYVPEQFN